MTIEEIYAPKRYGETNYIRLSDYGIRHGNGWGNYDKPFTFNIYVNKMEDLLRHDITGGSSNGKHYMSDNQSKYVF